MKSKIEANNIPTSNPSENPDIGFWLTTANQTALFNKQPAALQFSDQTNPLIPAIHVDGGRTYQTMDGFGFTLTGGSAYLLNRLAPAAREDLLTELFSPQGDGIGISYLRLSIGASDLSAVSFSYDDMPDGQADPELSQFNILSGDLEVIPILQQILAINPKINIIGAPWSAPPWMKTVNSFVGGSLKSDYYGVYANYFVKYIQAMHEYGIPIHAITPQNEPLNPENEPSMAMEANEQAEFIKNHLGPALLAAGLDTKIFCWDHNCDRPDYPLSIFEDGKAREFIAGSAWHLYGGDISALSQIHDAHPDKLVYFTEQWVGAGGDFGGALIWHARNVLLGAISNWSSVVLEWNLASDPDQGPHTPGGATNCLGALTIGDSIERNVAYYLIAHVSKFVRPGAVRIYSDVNCGLGHVAFKTPDNTVVLLVLNDGDVDLDFNIQFDGMTAPARMEASALGTFVWQNMQGRL